MVIVLVWVGEGKLNNILDEGKLLLLLFPKRGEGLEERVVET